jgi:hypothetical protein
MQSVYVIPLYTVTAVRTYVECNNSSSGLDMTNDHTRAITLTVQPDDLPLAKH